MTALFTTNKGGVSNMRHHFVHGAICINFHGKDIKALLSCLQKFVFCDSRYKPFVVLVSMECLYCFCACQLKVHGFTN